MILWFGWLSWAGLPPMMLPGSLLHLPFTGVWDDEWEQPCWLHSLLVLQPGWLGHSCCLYGRSSFCGLVWLSLHGRWIPGGWKQKLQCLLRPSIGSHAASLLLHPVGQSQSEDKPGFKVRENRFYFWMGRAAHFSRDGMDYWWTFFKIYFILFYFFSSVTIVCIFSPSLHPTLASPTSLPHLYPPPWFYPCVLYGSSYRPLSPLSPPHSPLAIVTLFLISMSLVIFCLLFSVNESTTHCLSSFYSSLLIWTTRVSATWKYLAVSSDPGCLHSPNLTGCVSCPCFRSSQHH